MKRVKNQFKKAGNSSKFTSMNEMNYVDKYNSSYKIYEILWIKEQFLKFFHLMKFIELNNYSTCDASKKYMKTFTACTRKAKHVGILTSGRDTAKGFVGRRKSSRTGQRLPDLLGKNWWKTSYEDGGTSPPGLPDYLQRECRKK